MKTLSSIPFLWLLVAALLATGCAGLPGRPRPPAVTLADLQILEAVLFEQRYRLRLRIQNPNADPLRVQAMDYELELNGRDFGRGVSSRPFTVPAFGETVVEVDLVSNISRVLDQVWNLGGGRTQRLSYSLAGDLRVADALFGKVPFAYRGEMALAPGG